MLNENKIKQPKQLTMENYKIIRDEDMKFWDVSHKYFGEFGS